MLFYNKMGKTKHSQQPKQGHKKARISSGSAPIREDLLSTSSISEIRQSHDVSGPYTHVVLDDLCNEESMRAIHEECKHNMVTDFKETDLFKLYQTGELANLDMDKKLAKKMPQLMALRSAIYSDKFRDFISKITGVDDLTDRCDCSANAYVQGCHLLCHDDVIGTRRVSYIIYLTDPDEEWTAEDGGALELFPLEKESITDRGPELGGKQGIPTNVPTCNILPKFNRMALFTVQPGRSYHSVQEVFADKPRISISGWFHGPDPPKGADKASLSQVMSKGQDQTPFLNVLSGEEMVCEESTGKVRPKRASEREEGEGEVPERDLTVQSEEEDITPEEQALLAEWVNPVYLRAQCMTDVQSYFCRNDSVQLKDFLNDNKAILIEAETRAADADDSLGGGRAPRSYTVGSESEEGEGGSSQGQGWAIVGPPHKRRYLSFDAGRGEELAEKSSNIDNKSSSSNSSSSSRCGQLLDRCRHELFESVAFSKLLRRLTTLEAIACRNDVRRFRPGLDYTVAHFGDMTKDPRLDATLCFVGSSVKTTGKGSVFPAKSGDSDTSSSEEEEEEEDEEEDEEEEGPDPYDDEWASGDCGGFECYIEADHRDNGEAAESYKVENSAAGAAKEAEEGGKGAAAADDDTTLLSVSPGFNVLSLVLRDNEVMRFVKYVSASAPSSRWDVAAEFAVIQVPSGSSDDEEEED